MTGERLRVHVVCKTGAHIDVDVPGVGLRQYSLCNAPGERHRYCIGVLRDPASLGGSAGMHDAVDWPGCLVASPPGAHLYVCGPSGFVEAVRAAAGQAGWRAERLHFQYFSGGPVHSAQNGGFEVVIKSSQKVIRVAPEQTVIDALDAHGVAVPASCLQGVCGTCLTRVLEGEVDHKDMYLSPEEPAANDQMLLCCSRARSARLVLDL
jgi:vanillate monooxygenase ferredoxin subunit